MIVQTIHLPIVRGGYLPAGGPALVPPNVRAKDNAVVELNSDPHGYPRLTASGYLCELSVNSGIGLEYRQCQFGMRTLTLTGEPQSPAPDGAPVEPTPWPMGTRHVSRPRDESPPSET